MKLTTILQDVMGDNLIKKSWNLSKSMKAGYTFTVFAKQGGIELELKAKKPSDLAKKIVTHYKKPKPVAKPKAKKVVKKATKNAKPKKN